MVPLNRTKDHFHVFNGIKCLTLFTLLQLLLHVNCQRDGRNLSFLSSSASSSSSSSSSFASSSSHHDESFDSRDRAAYIDSSLSRNAERFNSNLQTTKRPVKGQQSPSSPIISSGNFDSERDELPSESSSFSLPNQQPPTHGGKILDERQERPERKERPMKNEKGSSSSSREDEDSFGRDEERILINSNRNSHSESLVSSSTTTSTTMSSLYTGEMSTRPPAKKKSRTTRPPQVALPSSTTTTTSLPPTRSPILTNNNDHHVFNSHYSSTPHSFTLTSSPPLSSSGGNRPAAGLISPTLTASRPVVNGAIPSSSSSTGPKAPKEMSPFAAKSARCGGNITLGSLTTTITSPGWTEGVNYPPNVECIWIITTHSSHLTHREPSIRVRIKNLKVEQNEVECPFDYLEIRGYPRICGTIQNKELPVNGSSLVIIFRTDSDNEDRGFEIELYSHMDDCTPEVRAASTGEITSPGFPKNYPDSVDCWTLINANTLINSLSRSGGIIAGPENFTISVAFDFIELEPDDQCAYDFVEFYEVDPMTRKPTKSLGKFCDEKSINKLDRGSTDYIPDPRTTSNQPTPNRPNQGGPSPSSLPSSTSSFSLPNENNVSKPRLSLNTKGPYLLVHFKSDQLLNLRGFKADYKVEADLSRSSNSNCQWALDETSMILTSPNHPKAYPPNKDCSLILKAPRNDQKIVLVFESFLMEIDNNCTFDRLEIYDDYATTSVPTESNDGYPSSSSSNGNNNDHKKPSYPQGGGLVRGGDGDYGSRGFSSTGPTSSSSPSSSSSSSLQANGIPMAKEPTKVFCGHKTSKFKYLSGGPVIRVRFVSDSLHEHQGFLARYKYLNTEPELTPKPVQLFLEVPQNASIIPGSAHLLTCHPADLSSVGVTNNGPTNHDTHHNSGIISNHGNANTNNKYKENLSKNVLWFKENQLITDGVSENGTKLLIREFSQSDVGRYTCKYGSATSEAWLKVQNTDCRIIFRKRPRDIVLSEGEFTILECNAISPVQLASKVTITWTKNGKKLTNTSRIDRLKNGYLVINDVTQEDSGHYFCIVRLEDDPSCTSQAGARLDVNVRANVEDICGRPNLALPSKQKPLLDSAGKIVGGIDAQKGAFPWQVMFWDVNRKSFCGGALLNERWIATAAHCFTQNKYSPPPPPLDTIIVRLGKFDQKETEDQEVNTKVQDIIKHPDYNPETFDNDLALVRVKDHIIFTDYIKPVCVGHSRSLVDEIFFTDNHRSIKMGHVTGWGQLKENGPQPRYLQELRMPIVDQDSCRKATSFAVTSNMFCAGYAQEIIGDACKGDSGGPFVGHSSDRWYLLGIVSWGEGCGRTGKYGYYTKVSNYIDWVRGLIKH